MSNARGRDIVVGTVITASIVVLAATLLSVGTGRSLFRRQVEYKLRLSNTTGLSEGSPVKLVGVEIGLVSEISFPEDLNQKFLVVTLSVDRRYHDRIREDSTASLKLLSLLGGEKFVEIKPGSLNRAILPPGSTIQVPRGGALEILTERSEDISADMQVISAFFRRSVEEIERGEGFLGQLLTDRSFGSDTLKGVRDTVSSFSEVASKIEHGKGFAGRLLVDEEYGERQSQQIALALSRINSILEGIDNREGALGELLAEGSEAEQAISDLAVVLGSLKAIFEGLEQGQGLAGRLLQDDEYGARIASNLERLTANL
ncbi:MAG: MlaD family protein, partial [Acidobacteriota bacterium]